MTTQNFVRAGRLPRPTVRSCLGGWMGWSFGILGLAAFWVSALEHARAAEPAPKSTIVRTTPGGFSPVPYITGFTSAPPHFHIAWFGLTPPFQVQMRTNLNGGPWVSVGKATSGTTLSVPFTGHPAFFRIRGTTPFYVGAGTCLGCHPDTHARWAATKHAGALETLQGIGQGKNAFCLPCHTVGYGLPGGFVDETATPNLGGVQCENCHGPAGYHADTPSDLSVRPKIEMSAKVCGGCHTDAHHPTYDEWELSRHSEALATIQNLAFGQNSCLECHSQDYRYAREEGLELPTRQTAQLSIECSTCHTPHGASNEIAQLRKPVGLLCGECHTAGDSTLGTTPHHPQFQILSGYGPIRVNGTTMTNMDHPHVELAASGGAACAQCHVVKHTVENPNEGNPNVTGHTFNPFDPSITEHQAAPYTGCVAAQCHFSAEEAAEYREGLQSDVSRRLLALAPYFDPSSASYINPTNLTAPDQQRLSVAKFDWQYLDADKSKGVHNPELYYEALFVSESIVRSLSVRMLLQASALAP